MEVFDGGKWQRQHYFSIIFEIVAQFLNLKELLIFPHKREDRISSFCQKHAFGKESSIDIA